MSVMHGKEEAHQTRGGAGVSASTSIPGLYIAYVSYGGVKVVMPIRNESLWQKYQLDYTCISSIIAKRQRIHSTYV